jgi:uncharacterized protein (TIGR02453 family)
MPSIASSPERKAVQFTGFPRDALEFFRDLARHNDREWFSANRDRYERACREPMKLLVADLGADPVTSRITRINRDLRFSKDKSPYRTYIATGVRGNYIHLSADGLYVGAGFYKPEPATLVRFRHAIDANASGRALQRIITSLRRKRYMVETHEKLASAPRGFSVDHPRIEFLQMKDIFAGKSLKPGPWISTRRALERVKRVMTDVRPLADWLREYVGPLH